MSRTLIVAEVIDGQVSAVTAEVVAAAVSLGGEVVVAVAGPDAAAQAALLSYQGVDVIVTVPVPGSDRDHEQMAQVVTALVADVAPDLVLAAFTIRSTAWAAAAAYQADMGLASDVVAIARGTDGVRVTRSIYDGRVHASFAFAAERPVLALLRPSVWAAAELGATPQTRVLDVVVTPSRVRSVELRRPSDDVDLTNSDVVISVGRGVGSEENIAVFADIARRLGAALGASRPIIDSGWLPSAHQVGQTGVTVRPRVYVALGISGALHHVAGMQNSKTIVAVNIDQDAPIFGFADIGAVADIHQVAEQMQALL